MSYAQCPRCSSAVFDNRQEKAEGIGNPRRPDFKCSSRRCSWAAWSDTGRESTTRLAVTPGRRDEGAPGCGMCYQSWEWHPMWLWKQAEGGGTEAVLGQRMAIRHLPDRPCSRFNAGRNWGDGPKPEAPPVREPSKVEDIKARWRQVLLEQRGAA